MKIVHCRKKQFILNVVVIFNFLFLCGLKKFTVYLILFFMPWSSFHWPIKIILMGLSTSMYWLCNQFETLLVFVNG